MDFPFALFYCSRKRSKSSFQSKITVLGHEINMNWAQRFAPYSISLASCTKISVNLISICFSPSIRHFISSLPTSFLWNQPCTREKKDSVYSFSKDVTGLIQVTQLTQCLTHRKRPTNVDIISIKYEILFYIFILSHAFGKCNRKISGNKHIYSKYTQNRPSSQWKRHPSQWTMMTPTGNIFPSNLMV